MQNFVQNGDVVTVPAPYALLSGQAALVGALFGVAATAAAQGAAVEINREGVFDITALTTDVAAIGAKIYWDDAARRLTTTVAANTLVGALTAAKANGAVVARVLLDGVTR